MATPESVTPYKAAAQVWDQRIGSARVQAKNWRLMAFGCLSLAPLMAGDLVWRSSQSIGTPFVVEVDIAGQVRAVGEAATPCKPNDAQIAHHLARFVATIYDMKRRGEFPRRFNLTSRCVVWDLAEVEAWIEARRQVSDTAQMKRAPSLDMRQRKRRPSKQ